MPSEAFQRFLDGTVAEMRYEWGWDRAEIGTQCDATLAECAEEDPRSFTPEKCAELRAAFMDALEKVH